jgi:RNA polymerase sigma factor (sigma-70 family)
VGEVHVQDTFSKTWLYLVKGGKIVLMKAFLYHVLNNLIVDEYRKQKNRTESLDTLLEKGFEPKDDNSESFIDVLDGKVAMNKMVDLPKLYKKVMYMRFSNSMTLDDISHATGQTKNAISVKIYRGLQKLKILCSKRLSILKK